MSNYQGRLEDSQANKLLVTPHSMANIEDSDTASQIYTVGNMLVFNNRLCKVTAAIAQGDTLEVGTNIAYKGINDIGQQLCASDGKEFYFDVKDGTYGYYPSAAKVASEFVPFGGTSEFTYSITDPNAITRVDNSQGLWSTVVITVNSGAIFFNDTLISGVRTFDISSMTSIKIHVGNSGGSASCTFT